MAGRGSVLIGAAALLGAALVVAACAAGPAGPGAPGEPDLTGTWELVSGRSAGTPLPQPSGVAATLVFDGDQVGGRSFCNSYGSTYTRTGSSIEFAALGGTEMGCEPAVMAAETAYLTALGAVHTIEVGDAALVLSGDDVELRFRPLPPVPTSDLVGTRWVLDTLLDGETASSVLGEGWLRLDPDGTVAGSTGCRELTGTWSKQGELVVLGGLSATGDCTDELSGQDDHVLAVLGDGFRPEIEGDRLTVVDPDGRGLGYRAAG